jgi:hypothetical protein
LLDDAVEEGCSVWLVVVACVVALAQEQGAVRASVFANVDCGSSSLG